MDIIRNGSQASIKGPADYFTGTVRLDPFFLKATPPSDLTAALVTFEPGARTRWHTHPRGQTIIIMSGSGRVQREGGSIENVFSGDVVRFAPNERHWHGAGVTTAMTHIAIQEDMNGSAVTWQEAVEDSKRKPEKP